MAIPLTWVIGAGGLLGGAVSSEVGRRGGLVHRERIPWGDVDRAVEALSEGLARVVERSRQTSGAWRVAWCAGAGVTSTAGTSLGDEVRVFRRVLELIADLADSRPEVVFLASSAGGVYAGSANPPFTELHPPQPISAYGEAKLAMEDAATAFGVRTGTPVLIGRIANLYGPGQNLGKPQGLISHICRAHLIGQPISIYVPLDTVRDYLFVHDCAAMIVEALDARARYSIHPVVKIFASQQGATVAALLGECRRIFKRSPRVVLGQSANAQLQARDLRLRSVVWPDVDRRTLTPLPVGIKSTVGGLLRSVQLAR